MTLTVPLNHAFRWFIALGVAALTLSVTMLAPGVDARTQTHHTVKGRYGGSITARLIFPPDCLNPLKSLTAGAGVDSAIFDTLLSSDERGRVRPNLAVRWTFSHKARWVTFFLRHGVHFSNGDPLSATSVKYSLEQALKSPVTAAGLGPLVSVRSIDRSTLRVVLKSPFRPLLENLRFAPFIVDPRSLRTQQGDASCRQPAGSGPFKVQSVEPGFSTVTAVRNPYHNWNAPWIHNGGRAYLSKIVFRPILSDTTAASSLLSGEVDLTRLSVSELDRVQGNAGITLHEGYEQAEEYLGFNTAHSPFDKVAVRRAIAESIDRLALVKVALGGFGKPAFSPIAPTESYYDSRAGTYAPRHNVAEARRILAANHVVGPFTMITYPIPAFATSAELIQAELAQVGVKTNIVLKAIPDAQAVLRQGQYDLNIDILGGNDLYQRFHSSQLPDRGGFNVTFYRNAQLDHLIVQSRTTIRRKAAVKVFNKLQRFIDSNVVIDPLFTRLLVVGTRSHLRGWHVSQGSSTALFPVWQDLYLGTP
ncbi:MAG: ABC transporter substrate-binding protein [Chloroflexota bacterium]|nr:MAG: hypothetical protein DLM70_03125 [Chloroflexota bacterium]